jgi:hypothetical protein
LFYREFVISTKDQNNGRNIICIAKNRVFDSYRNKNDLYVTDYFVGTRVDVE